MVSRSFWGARADEGSAGKRGKAGENERTDDLLDARFAEDGRLAGPQKPAPRRPAERSPSVDDLDLAVRKLSEGLEEMERRDRSAAPAEGGRARSAASGGGGEETVTHSLDRLEARLEALSKRLQQRGGEPAARRRPERHDVREDPPAKVEPEDARTRPEPEDAAAQLAESRRLAEAEEAAERAEQAPRAQAERERRESEPREDARPRQIIKSEAQRRAEAMEAQRRAELAEAKRQAEIAEARRQAEQSEARRQNELAEARRRAEMAETRRHDQLAEAMRRADEAETRRQAEVTEAMRQAEAADARRRAEVEAADEKARRQAEEAAAEQRRAIQEAEAVRLADVAEARRQAEAAEARRRAEMEEAQKKAEVAAARREAEMAATIERQFSEIEARIDALQASLDENRVEPVRAELIELVKDMSDLSRSGRAAGEGLAAIGSRLDEMEMKLNAARNMAGNRLGDIQDKLSGLVERIEDIEVEIPGFDAIRENQGAVLERFDRMEGLVHRLAAAEELLERVDGLKRQLQTVSSQREVARVEEQLLKLADRVDALPDELSDEEALKRIEAALGSVATDLVEARRQRKSVAMALEDQLAELSTQLREVGESGRTPDLSGLEERISALGAHLTEDRRAVGESFAQVEGRLTALAAQIKAQEEGPTAEVLSGLTERMEALAGAIAAQDAPGARRDIGSLDRKLAELSEQVAAQARHLSQKQIEPLEARLQDMHAGIGEIGKRAQDTSALFKPLVQKLHDISDRLAELGAEDAATPLSARLAAIEGRLAAVAGKSSDPRGLQTQLDAIVSRLEVLKGRSIDPVRLNELFDRMEYAVRMLPEERAEGGEISAGALERLERRITAAVAGGAPGESFSRLEKKLDDIGRTFSAGGESMAPADVAELRSEIASLRSELRSMPTASGAEPNLGELMRAIALRLERLPQEGPKIAQLEAQIERIARVLDDPEKGPAGLARIEASLKTIEKRLDDTRRSLGYRPPRDVAAEVSDEEQEAISGLARALSEDVSLLRSSAEAADKKTTDAIDSVQDTLEAVVKRIAFLERDADGTAPAPKQVEPAPPPPEPKRAAAPEPNETPSGGLLSRFTSRQLLRRATGGRAESFSPEAEEPEEASDLPLEPGTDSPLDSSLSGAPSSDTEFMSGARKGRASKSLPRGRDEEQPIVDDDFLAAARRAARAAAEEVSDTGEEVEGGAQRRGGVFSGRRAAVAAALAAALVIAAVVIVRSEVWPYKPIMALINGDDASLQAPASAPAVAVAPPMSDDANANANMSAASAPAMAPATTPSSSMAEAPSAGALSQPSESSVLRPEDFEGAPAADSGSQTPVTASDTTTPSAAEPVETPAEVASIAPAAQEPVTQAPPMTSPPAGAATTASLPDAIGPARLRDAALAGDRIAEFEVGARYAEGRGVLEDMPTAVAWYEEAAEAGLAPAQYRLGSIYEKGLGVPRDLTKAQQWYRRAAEEGNVKAMHNLAVLYAEGAAGEPDLERAASLFRQAAEHGVRDSQFNLAILHARGLGVPQDLVEAYKWFAVAASSGDEESAKRRDIIAQALTEEDRAKAEAEAATFQPLPLAADANEVQMPDWRSDDNATSVEVDSHNELVALVQKLLAENGYDPGPPDGLLGERTIDAISQFQDRAGLPKTGRIDPELVAALQNRPT